MSKGGIDPLARKILSLPGPMSFNIFEIVRQAKEEIPNLAQDKNAAKSLQYLIDKRMFFGETWIAIKPIQPQERLLGELL